MLTLPPLSLYIHIPWCIRKCPYCDFNSHENNANNYFDEAFYIETLINDLFQEKDRLNKLKDPRKLHSIFFGGGTPSLFSAKGIEKILQSAEKIIGFDTAIEITLEANPSTFEQEKFSGFHKAGVNRLSIGVQTFNSKHLHTLGRIHNGDEAKNAISIAQQSGFNNINIDLMHGLPEQTTEDAIADIQTAIEFSPQHISWYQLTIEPNTQFYTAPPSLPKDDILDDIYDRGHQLLAKAGFQQYEISAFSQANLQSKHNINYWTFGDYIGIGAGAHGKLSNPQLAQIVRTQKTRLPEHYLKNHQAPNTKTHIIEANELPMEFMMNTLRLIDGVEHSLFTQRTGLPLATIEPLLHQLTEKELLKKDSGRIVTTALGSQFLNSVLEQCSDYFSEKKDSSLIYSEKH